MSKFLRTTPALLLSIFLLNVGSHAQATFRTIHTFTAGGDGFGPTGALVEDSHGNLFGTTGGGGAYSHGSVYELSPPTSSALPGQKPSSTASTASA